MQYTNYFFHSYIASCIKLVYSVKIWNDYLNISIQPSKKVPERSASSFLQPFLGHLHPKPHETSFCFTRCMPLPHLVQFLLSESSLCLWHQCTVVVASPSSRQRSRYVIGPVNQFGSIACAIQFDWCSIIKRIKEQCTVRFLFKYCQSLLGRRTFVVTWSRANRCRTALNS